MSRPRRARSSPVQLFPFLAVLVSTMGALILLLLAINRQASLQAIARAVGLLAERTSSEEEALARRRDELEGVVANLREQLLRLRDEQKGIEEKLVASDRKARGDAARADSFRAELARVRSRRFEIERDLESVTEQIAIAEAAMVRFAAERSNSHRTFVPVVHPGANGTDRQPIYIECTGDTVTIWPEKVEVPTAALDSSKYARAGLARAIRDLGQYYLQRDLRAESGLRKRLEPYPLLLVRPNGVDAFYLVYDALVRERGFSFGYELLEADWSVQFPDPDPRAREVIIAALKKTSLGPRVADGAAVRPPNEIASNEPTGSRSMGDEQGGMRGSRNDVMREPSAVGSGPAELQLPGSPMADGSRLYSDELVFSQLSGGPSEQTPAGTVPAQRLTGRQPSPAAESQPPGRDQDARQPSAPDQRVAREVQQNPSTVSEHELNRPLATSTSTARRSDDAGEPTGADLQAGRLAGDPRGPGRITIPRRIETTCHVDRLVVGPRQTVIALPKTGSFDDVLGKLRDEIDREVAAWGPPGRLFEWQPHLFCRVHTGALDTYYRLRFELAGTSIAFEHEIVLEEEFEFDADSLLGEAPWPTINAQPIME